MDRVIERLKRDRDAAFAAGKKSGADAGVTWAKESASLRDLRALCEPPEEAGPGLLIPNTNALDDYNRLDLDGAELDGAEKTAREGGYDFDSYLAGWREGFEEGATSVWNEVRDKI